MPWDGEEEVSGMEGKEGSDRSDREEQLDVKAEQVFLCLFDFSMSGFVLALDLFKCNLLYLSNKMVSETAVLQSQ